MRLTLPATVATQATNPFYPPNSVPLSSFHFSIDESAVGSSFNFTSSDSSALVPLLKAVSTNTFVPSRSAANVKLSTPSCSLDGRDGALLVVTLIAPFLSDVKPLPGSGGVGFSASIGFDAWKIAYTPRGAEAWGTTTTVSWNLRGQSAAPPDFGKIGTAVAPACGGLGYPGDDALAISLGQGFTSDEISDLWPAGSFRLSGLEQGELRAPEPTTGTGGARGSLGSVWRQTKFHFTSFAGLVGLAQTFSNPSPTNKMVIATPTCTRGEQAGRWYAATYSGGGGTSAIGIDYDGSSLDFSAKIGFVRLQVTVTPGTGESNWGTPAST